MATPGYKDIATALRQALATADEDAVAELNVLIDEYNEVYNRTASRRPPFLRDLLNACEEAWNDIDELDG